MTNNGPGRRIGTRIALVAAAGVAVLSIAYAALRDNPSGKAASPETVRSEVGAPDADSVIRSLQEAVGAAPRDPARWRKLGEGYYLARRYEDATRAYRRAAGLAPEDAATWSAYGEAAVMASQHDPMPDEALVAFRKAAALDPKDARARYFLAVARDLTGDHEGAISDWLTLLGDTPPGAPYEADLKRTIEQVGKINGIDVAGRIAAVKQPAPVLPSGDPVATGAIPGPTAEQMAAASSIPPGAQDEMVAGMVARLEGRLKASPGDVDGWIMLMRSRMALGQAAKARAARDAALAANPTVSARIRSAAETLGVPQN